MSSLLTRLRSLPARWRRDGKSSSWIYAHDVPSAATESECHTLAELAAGGDVLELGAFYGRSTIALASTANSVHSVDPHDGGSLDGAPLTLDAFLRNLERYGVREKVHVHVARSADIATQFAAESFDLIFVDAMHQRPDVDFDLAIAARVVRPGGAIAFHDYGRDGVMYEGTWHAFGVTEAVDEFLSLARLPPPKVVDHLAMIRSPAVEDEAARVAWDSALPMLPLAPSAAS